MAVTNINKWKTSDGSLFDTKDEAEEYEENSKGQRLAARILSHHAAHFGFDDDAIRNLSMILGSSLSITARRAKRKEPK